ncbi:MAG TPA: hypothetical protein VHE14_04745 [Solirubrobacteraceae bacterium]|nr:hypothetical protein [Solirubrobacteraceae bacterium]
MAIGMYFHPASFSAEQYDAVDKRLQDAGARNPPGRTHHCCFGSGDKLQVFDVWESQEDFDRFGATLMPILAEIGVDAGQPMVEPIHSVIVG